MIDFSWQFVDPQEVKKRNLYFILLGNTFLSKFKSFYSFRQRGQPQFQAIERKLNIYFTMFLGFDLISQLEICLLVLTTLEQIFNDKVFSKLATVGRHRNIIAMYVKDDLFQRSKWSRTIDLNTSFYSNHLETYSLILSVNTTTTNTDFLRYSYELATKRTFVHLLIDLYPKTSDSMRFWCNITPPGPSIFYLPSW